MSRAETNKVVDDRNRKSAEALQFSEDRAQLLDTIREMIDDELDRRGFESEDPHAHKARALPQRSSLWERIVDFFTTI